MKPTMTFELLQNMRLGWFTGIPVPARQRTWIEREWYRAVRAREWTKDSAEKGLTPRVVI